MKRNKNYEKQYKIIIQRGSSNDDEDVQFIEEELYNLITPDVIYDESSDNCSEIQQ